MPPNQISGVTATTVGICSILWRYASGMKLARPVACCTTMWVAPLPVPVVPSIPSRNDDRTTIRTSTRTIEAIVKKARIFLRKTFFQMKRKYFTASPRVPRSLDDRRRLRRQHPLVQMELPVGASRGPRVVRQHDDRLVVLLVQAVEQDEDLLGALRVQVPGRLVGHQDQRIGDDGPRDGDALLLAAGQLAGVVIDAVRQADDRQRHLHVLVALPARQAREQERQLDVLEAGEDRDQVV